MIDCGGSGCSELNSERLGGDLFHVSRISVFVCTLVVVASSTINPISTHYFESFISYHEVVVMRGPCLIMSWISRRRCYRLGFEYRLSIAVAIFSKSRLAWNGSQLSHASRS